MRCRDAISASQPPQCRPSAACSRLSDAIPHVAPPDKRPIRFRIEVRSNTFETGMASTGASREGPRRQQWSQFAMPSDQQNMNRRARYNPVYSYNLLFECKLNHGYRRADTVASYCCAPRVWDESGSLLAVRNANNDADW